MENISDDKQTLQSDDAKTGKHEIMKTVVNMYSNEQTIQQTIFWKGELTTTVQTIICMGIISFSETHINYKIESRLNPNAPINVSPQREAVGYPWGLRHF